MYSMFITENDEIGWKERNADDSQTYGFLTFMGLSQSKEKKYVEYSTDGWPGRRSKKKRHTVYLLSSYSAPLSAGTATVYLAPFVSLSLSSLYLAGRTCKETR
jgi:hypothetical protein